MTDAAVTRARELLTKYEEDRWLRLGIRGGGCSGLSYFMDWVTEPLDKDLEFEFDGVKVCVDRKSYLYLNGTEVDWKSDLISQLFVFHNPIAKRTCSCGESFGL